jgi:hypothetical protein
MSANGVLSFNAVTLFIRPTTQPHEKALNGLPEKFMLKPSHEPHRKTGFPSLKLSCL